MKNPAVFISLFLFSVHSQGQIIFERGYFIDTAGKRITCLIKNYDWDRNPFEFEWKAGETDTPKKETVLTARGFGIEGYSHYVTANVLIDTSSTDPFNLSQIRKPEWKKQVVFLKVLVEGNATLYYYHGATLTRYFYSSHFSHIHQLIFKEYSAKENEVVFNRDFRTQLLNDVSCGTKLQATVKNLNYRKRDLEKYFKSYNECSGGVAWVPETKPRNAFSLSIAPGVSLISLNIVNNFQTNPVLAQFDDKIIFRVGLDAQYILPFNKNKWSLVFEPSLQEYRSKTHSDGRDINVNYRTIESAIGIRHFFYLREQRAIFLNALFNFANGISNSQIDFGYLQFKTTYSNNYGFGAGFNMDRFAAEIRYYTAKNISTGYSNLFVSYRTVSLIISYKFISIKK